MDADNKQVWRLIPLLEAPGQVQMAIDGWLLQQHLAGHLSSLRFYTWSPSAISLGYHQRQYPAYWQDIVWQGEKLELVRRPTGGRAVLHQGDLTYAVVTSRLNGSRIQMYEKICEFLIQGWRSLDVELHYGTAGRGYIHNPNCFGTATSADLVTVDNCKLIGSAQLRRGKAILQHGSIRLQPNAELFATVFGAEAFSSVQLLQNLTMETIIAALVAAAIDCFNIELVLQPLSEDEWKQILATK
jgi:lipoate---protein ligase